MNTERSFKCRICGGEVTWEKGFSMGECIYCGSKQPIPSNLTAHTQDLYNDAFEYLKKNEYDKAFVVYENIIKENPNDAEAYWGRCLCRYGIEYVDDPNTGKKIPTCHRLQAKSILKDEDYLSALKYAPDEATKSLYTMRATTIDVIQRDIISISQGEEGKYDIFISFKDTDNNENRTKDSHLAEEIYNELTKQGYKVFFSRVTLAQKLGAVYEPYIYAAIHSAKIMIVVGTKPEYIESAWVRNEWSRYLDLIREGNDKKLIVCFKDMSRKALPEEFVPFQNLDMNERGSMIALVQNIEKIVKPSKKEVKETTPKKEKKKSGCGGCLIPLLIVLGIIGAIVYFAWGPIQNLWQDIQYEAGMTDNPSSGNNNRGNTALSGELTQIQLNVDKTSIMYGDTVHLSFSTSPSNPTKVDGKSYNANCIEYYIRVNGVDKRINNKETSLDYVVESTGEISFWAKYCHHSSHSDTAGDVVSNEVKITVANENGLYYKDNGTGMTIVGYSGISSNLTIPSTINEKPVTSIQSRAFENCDQLISVVVPDSIVEISLGAFFGCNNLEEITLPFIGANRNESISTFGHIFGDETFMNSKISYTANGYYHTTANEEFTSQGKYTGKRYENYYVIPKSVRRITITDQSNIPDYAFQNCDLLTSVVIEKPIDFIGSYAFQGCSTLSNVEYEANDLARIRYAAFSNCINFTNINIPEGVTMIEKSAFQNCTALKTVIIPTTVTEIGFGAFNGCNSLAELELPFVGKNRSVEQANHGTLGYIFGDDSIEDGNISTSNYHTIYKTSEGKNMTTQAYSHTGSGYHQGSSIWYSGGVDYYSYYAIPKSLRRVIVTDQSIVPAYSFRNCDLIVEVTFEKELSSIDQHAFENCSSLSIVNYQMGSASLIQEYAFANCDSIKEINVQEGVLKIGAYAFSGNDWLKTVMLPMSLQSIENHAFSDCMSLTDVNIQNGCKTINKLAFKNCGALQTITIPKSVNELGWAVFYGCNSLKDLTIPFIGQKRSTEQGNHGTLGYIFGDDSPENDDISNSNYHTVYKTSESKNMTTQAYSHTGSGYHQGSSIWYSGGVDYYSYYAIPKSLRKVTVTDQSMVPAYAFRNCDLIVEIAFEQVLATIGAQAFEGCSSIKTVYYEGTQAEWNDIVFGVDWNKNANDFSIVYNKQ